MKPAECIFSRRDPILFVLFGAATGYCGAGSIRAWGQRLSSVGLRSTLEAGTLVAKPISREGVPLTWGALFMKGNNIPIYQKEFIKMMQRANVIGQV